ncbi:MAG: sialate O-acetylesterase [Planctomycetota bacterium]
MSQFRFHRLPCRHRLLPLLLLAIGILNPPMLPPAANSATAAELKLPTIFGSSMVLQRDKPIHVWGWATAGDPVSVTFGDAKVTATADDSGRFDAMLPAMTASTTGRTLEIAHGDESIRLDDVLVGEVWVCSGQSNMAWPVANADDPKLEALTANFPNMRIISVPNKAAQEPMHEFVGKWEAVTPETVKTFSAVGYFFGRRLHQTLGVPVGLIDNAWGGSAAEAWVEPSTLEEAGTYGPLLEKWDTLVKNYDPEKDEAELQRKLKRWQENGRKGRRPRAQRNTLQGNQRPGNLYYGCLHPIIGYTIRGAIWYQGESNSSRAYQYRDLFPRMIKKWRADWKQGDFSFYWVQLADFRKETPVPGQSDWAELREAQSMTLSLPNTGQAVIIDTGESNDIHPRDKQTVAKRLARWALVKDYGIEGLAYESPTMQTVQFQDGKAIIDFRSVGGGLDTFDVGEIRGFTIAGKDQKFVPAMAKILDKDTVEVMAASVASPIAVRYGWADNPVVNLQSREGLPATPFRSDDFPGVTVDKVK